VSDFVKTLLASALMGCAAWYTVAWLGALLPGSAFILRLARVSAAIGVGIGVLLASARVLQIEGFEEARRRVLRRLGRG
jgi:peptidoglycan biosynthesis protein MviN/MurJ (putative lipid II flippase)